MVERMKKVRDQKGNLVEGISVGVVESTERFSEVRLEDGTTIRTKLSVFDAVRIDGQWDKEGNPVYVVKSHNIVTVVESPERLKKVESLKEPNRKVQ